MPGLLFADNFLAGAVLTLLMPTILLSAIAVYYMVEVRHVPSDTPRSSTETPSSSVLAAAEEAEPGSTSQPPVSAP